MNKKFNCCIKDHKGETIHDEDYKTLMDISNDLGLTKAMVYDLNSRKTDMKYKKFRFYSQITINKILDNNNREE